jgi:hypothetical protein
LYQENSLPTVGAAFLTQTLFFFNLYQENSLPTVGAAFLTQTLHVEGKTLKLEIW